MAPARQSPFPTSLGGPLGVPPPRAMPNQSKKLLETSAKHFKNIIRYISIRKEECRQSLTSVVPDMEGGFQDNGGRWGEINCPQLEMTALIPDI